MADPLLAPTDDGLYCPAGDFHIDPWRPVPRAVVTHGHADHCRPGCGHYLVAAAGTPVYRARLGPDADLRPLPYGEPVTVNGVRVSLHPAGHILGSAQVRLELGGKVWVVSGDFKTNPDPTCAAFEPVRCHVFITESTFGLPIYRWPAPGDVFADVNAWWRANKEAGKASLLYGYALGKAQRLLAGVDPAIGPIYLHGAVDKLTAAYREAGVALPPTKYAEAVRGFDWSGSLIVAPPSAHQTPWTRKFGTVSTGFASGWMTIRGTRRRKAVDRGFVLSDHADWPGLLSAIAATGAERVGVTHGYTAVLVRWLRERGADAWVLPTRYEGETDDPATEGVAAETDRDDGP
ncbi:MAG TPA: ligase-associated DNA damage response exonuclease [Gemmataceae bacterium]|jgi:putative mRNA 3-end processing factor